MAWINKQHCRACGTETDHNHNDCLACQERKRQEAEAAWMAKPLDERLLHLYRRVNDLARGPMRF